MNRDKYDENISLDALRKGDKKAFAQLVKANSEAIYRLALRMLNDPQDAEDILQETFIKAFHYLPNFEGRSKLSTWLYRIAVNESLMHIRKKKPQVTSIDEENETDQGDLVPKQIIDWCCLPEDSLLTSETQEYISKAVQDLSPANRAAFLLRDISGLSTREAAQALEISESALKTRLSRARLEMRELLTSYFSERMAAA